MSHEYYMHRCLELAQKGLGSTRPNPSVGAVVVYNGQIIGEGFTSAYGGPHAEVNAIGSVKDKTLLKKSTLYVTLEPCSHFGKTPPCSDFIIENEIPQVVIGCIDDNPLVGGKGVLKLKAHQVNVVLGILERECKEQHKRFFTFHQKKRPYVILKWAASQDGFIAPKERNQKAPVWITGIEARQLVHQWRAEEHAILVGANTVKEDNPSLTVRTTKGKNPIRIVLDSRNQLSTEFKVFDSEAKTIRLPLDEPAEILNKLHHFNIQSVIIEGGAKTLQSFIDSNLWDEARVFIGKVNFQKGISAPLFPLDTQSELKVGRDLLKIYRND